MFHDPAVDVPPVVVNTTSRTWEMAIEPSPRRYWICTDLFAPPVPELAERIAVVVDGLAVLLPEVRKTVPR